MLVENALSNPTNKANKIIKMSIARIEHRKPNPSVKKNIKYNQNIRKMVMII
jgi:hypothetical protein